MGSVPTYRSDAGIAGAHPTLHVLPADDFALTTVSLDPRCALRAVQAIADRSGRVGESWSEAEVLDRLEDHYGMGDTVDLLRQIMI